MKTLVERWKEARAAFIRAYDALREQEDVPLRSRKFPVPARRHFESLGLAIYALDSYTKDQLEDYARRGIVHGSTIQGGSLSIARQDYERVLGFSAHPLRPRDIRDTGTYEQLYRICGSAADMFKNYFRLGDRRVERE